DKLIAATDDYQVYLNHPMMDSLKLDAEAVKKYAIQVISKTEGIARVFDLQKVGDLAMNPTERERFVNGYYPRRSGDIQYVLQPGWIDGGATGTTHGVWNPYDAHIPLLFYGWKIRNGKTNRETYMTDIAATVAALLHIQMPSGCVGKV